MSFSQPGRGDVHVNRPLTNISVAFMQSADAFIADRVFPVVPVQKQSDLYYTIPRGHFFRPAMEKRAPGAKSVEVNYQISSDSYLCDVWALSTPIADQVRANYDNPLDPDREATEFLSLQGLLRKELQWASTYFTTGVWTGDLTGVAAAPGANQFLQWNDAASNPIEDIRLGKRRIQARTGHRPNKLVLGREVYDTLLDHPDLVGRVDRGQTTGAAIVMKQTLAALFELDEILVMDGIQNTAAEGLADVFSFIGGKSALLVYTPARPGLQTATAGYTFSWTGFLGAGALGTRMKRMREERKESDLVEIQMAFDHKVVSADLGQFFATAIA